jgi:hypothetical protein
MTELLDLSPLAPLSELLVSGGDLRLVIDPETGCNKYGCRPEPRDEIFSLSTSTASTISARAYEHVQRARRELAGVAGGRALDGAFDSRLDRLRDELRDCLSLDPAEAEIVFCPSGSDAQLLALFIAKAVLGPTLTSVVVGSDQTGSATGLSLRGRHFCGRTPDGRPVDRDAPIAGLSEETHYIGIPLCDDAGRMRPECDTDETIAATVSSETRAGRGVLLHIMNSSKLGWRAPSDACVRHICFDAPGSVVVVVDACQMRIGRSRIREYLRQNYLILITGSKFFSGPPFSGALLVPPGLARDLESVGDVPPALRKYSSSYDWPRRLRRIREALPRRPNFGQWLRWEAAIAEMRAYFALPSDYRFATLRRLQSEIERTVSLSGHASLLPGRCFDVPGEPDDEEMAARTIFPFVVRAGRRVSSSDAASFVYQRLNCDSSGLLPEWTKPCDKALASRLFQIGQPVKLPGGGAALRISVGARMLSECWSPDAAVAEANIRRELQRVAETLGKIALLVECC